MLLTTFQVDYPILRETLSHAPDIELTWVRSDLTADGDHRLLAWVEGDDLEAFENELEDDPTVTPPSPVAEFDGRRLYQFELTPAGQQASVYPLVIDEGGVLREVTATAEGWRFRVVFPDEAAVERFHAFFREQESTVELRRLHECEDGDGGNRPRSQFGLTDRQCETLIAAVNAGYLDIPRSCSLAELGERFGISPNATSERFRRGVRTLVENTVYPDDESSTDGTP
ncbi:helix-turn-helix domain-containing protein [Natrinema salifodinae]|uniref:HTH DNA binding domain-containing protein n=1 Tax=Natrinema salifodinae TaxID=1202768 RepID=A0A1I0PCD6_9EURY|nr:helix-turn-helix domain-containing protein [Natrinema salifodinae]SEW12059.1 hypothetical protein SAMN05216285_2418 [Natrinema salifodinae]